MTSGVRLHNLNEDFFNTWSPNMAYILGFTCADGCVYGRMLSWELSNKNPSEFELLERFAKEISSTSLVEKRRQSFRLRVNSVAIVKRLECLGVFSNKSKVIKFPVVPKEYLPHFIRGILDGDGWISIRSKRKSNEFTVGFVSGSRIFVEGLAEAIGKNLGIENIYIRNHHKLSKGGINSFYYSLELYRSKAMKIINFLYDNLSRQDLFLLRKYEKQLLARKLSANSQRIIQFGKKWVRLENEKGIVVKEELIKMFEKEDLLPREIAVKLGVSLATIYRWLEKVNLRIPITRRSNG